MKNTLVAIAAAAALAGAGASLVDRECGPVKVSFTSGKTRVTEIWKLSPRPLVKSCAGGPAVLVATEKP